MCPKVLIRVGGAPGPRILLDIEAVLRCDLGGICLKEDHVKVTAPEGLIEGMAEHLSQQQMS
jgi:hypothetical protein